MDQRKTIRYPVNCPAMCRWTVSDARKQTSFGLTRDISVRGVFVLNNSSPPIGTPIELNIAIPNLSGEAHGLYLVATGSVIRIDELGDYARRGFAAEVQFDPIAEEEAGIVQPRQESMIC
jgi:hypothetical protein